MGYQDLANSYSREADLGSQMQDQNNQRMVGATGSLFDRFQQAFLQRQQMQRQSKLDQQALEHEMWLRKRDEGIDQTNRDWHQAATQERVGKQIYDEFTGDPSQRALFTETLLRGGIPQDKIDAMFPKGTYTPAAQGKTLGDLGEGPIETPGVPGGLNRSDWGGGARAKAEAVDALAKKEMLDRAIKSSDEQRKADWNRMQDKTAQDRIEAANKRAEENNKSQMALLMAAVSAGKYDRAPTNQEKPMTEKQWLDAREKYFKDNGGEFAPFKPGLAEKLKADFERDTPRPGSGRTSPAPAAAAAPSVGQPKTNYEGEISPSGKYVFKSGAWVAK